jgi:uncharacterized membrane protein (UPF0127 family)
MAPPGTLLHLRHRGAIVIPAVRPLHSFAGRLLGLMGRRPLPPGAAVHLAPCAGIHTWFKRFPLDLVFLDRNRRVVRIRRGVRPWRLVAGGRGAASVLELTAGWLPPAALREGDGVELSPALGRTAGGDALAPIFLTPFE